MNQRTSSFLVTTLIATCLPAAAQWLNVPTKGIPRTKEVKPDLTAPTPRKPDGKPDLSGVWQMDPNGFKYAINLFADLKPGELPIQPWAEAVAKMNEAQGGEYPPAHCLPPSIPVLDIASVIYPLKIVHGTHLGAVGSTFIGPWTRPEGRWISS